MSSPCNPKVTATGITEAEAEQLLLRVKNLAQLRAAKTGQPIDQALREIAGEIKAEESMMAKIHERNALLTLQKKQELKNYAARFVQAGRSIGEGVLAFLQGSSRLIGGARKSLDYQAKATHGKYFGRLVAELEQAGVLSAFKNPDENMLRDIYREMGATHPGMPAKSVTNNKTAFAIAQVIEGVTAEMVARQNRAGAYIRRVPGYITRQTHDQSAIRAIGRVNGQLSKEASFQAWYNFVIPLIDQEKTFLGTNPQATMRMIHEGLYTGIHGPARDESDITGVVVQGALAKKLSEMRVLHFIDADAALKYNQAFGIKDFKEQILHDLHVRARSIALMENLGPSPEAALQQVIRELGDESRMADDAAKHVDSLKDWRIQAAMNEITGKNEMSGNPTLSNITGTAKVLAQMARMGSVLLSSFSDRAFLQAEMAHQGMAPLQVFAKQLTSLLPNSAENKQMLRLMGVAMDGLLGNALSRYSNHSTVSGWAHTLQKHFFNLNGLNLWTDASKGAAAQLMAAHLGEHAHLSLDELPGELRNILSLYDITKSRWDAIRSHVVEHEGAKLILPSEVRVDDATIVKLVQERGLEPTAANIARERDALDTALRTYIADRVDIAVPTPGAAERKYSTFDTRAGTPLGEAVRMIMLFKSFPITVMRKVIGREIYGRGATSMLDWLQHDHRGKFNLAMMMAMATVLGYTSGAIRDALKGRTPKPLVDDDGKLVWGNINDAVIRGGSLGILGDVLFNEYDSHYRGFLDSMAGPIVGNIDALQNIKTGIMNGRDVSQPTGKLLLDNAPMINLFYIRPVLDYLWLWNMQEMLSPGSLSQMESFVERNNKQGFFVRPSEVVNK